MDKTNVGYDITAVFVFIDSSHHLIVRADSPLEQVVDLNFNTHLLSHSVSIFYVDDGNSDSIIFNGLVEHFHSVKGFGSAVYFLVSSFPSHFSVIEVCFIIVS